MSFSCPNCSLLFSKDNLPLAIRCSHTYCQTCLVTLKSIHIHKYLAPLSNYQFYNLACPMDQQPIAYTTLDEFPLNKTLARLLKLDTNARNTTQQNTTLQKTAGAASSSSLVNESKPQSALVQKLKTPSPPREQKGDSCLLHNKQADLVCVDCASRICSNCALFGDHRNHKILTVDNVIEECASVAEQTVGLMAQIKELEENISWDSITEKVDKNFKEKRERLTKLIKGKFFKLMDKIKSCQEAAIKELATLIEQEKKAYIESLHIEQLDVKKQNWFEEAETLGTLMDSIFLKKKVEEATKYIDSQTKESAIVQRGEYLIVEINTFTKISDEKLKLSLEDICVELNSEIEAQMEKTCRIYKNVREVEQIPIIANIVTTREIKADDDFLLESLAAENGPNQYQQLDHLEAPSIIPVMHVTPDSTDIPSLQFDRLDLSIPSFNEKSSRTADESNLNKSYIIKEPLTIQNNNYIMPESTANGKLPVNNNKKKLKLKIPEKYEQVIEDLRCDKSDCIDLTNAELGDAIILALCEYIRGSSKLRTLKLIRNKLTDECLNGLLEACRESKVCSLNLGQNLMSDKALDILGTKETRELRSVTLSQNKINQRNCRAKIADFKKIGLTVSV